MVWHEGSRCLEEIVRLVGMWRLVLNLGGLLLLVHVDDQVFANCVVHTCVLTYDFK